MPSIPFGIGCIHFGIDRSPPYLLSGAWYVNQLKTALSALPGIRHLKLEADEDFALSRARVQPGDSLPSLDSGPGYFPHPNFLDLKLTLDLQQLPPPASYSFGPNLYSGTVHLMLHHTFYLPVAFFFFPDAGDSFDPSFGVMCMRDWLSAELDCSDTPVRLEVLGPTPFHAKCFLKTPFPGASSLDWRFRGSRTPSDGYDVLDFEYNPAVYESVEQAAEALTTNTATEIGFFYEIVQSASQQQDEWAEIAKSLRRIVDMDSGRSLTEIWDRIRRKGPTLSRTMVRLAEFQAGAVEKSQHISTQRRSVYDGGTATYFGDWINREIENQVAYPVKHLADLLIFIEARRARAIDVLALFGSALAGGAVASALTSLLQMSKR